MSPPPTDYLPPDLSLCEIIIYCLNHYKLAHLLLSATKHPNWYVTQDFKSMNKGSGGPTVDCVPASERKCSLRGMMPWKEPLGPSSFIRMKASTWFVLLLRCSGKRDEEAEYLQTTQFSNIYFYIAGILEI